MVDKKKSLIVWLSYFIALAFITIGLILINKSDNKTAEDFERKATPVGLKRAKEECTKEGIRTDICDTITGSAGTTECHGQTCWIVYAHAKNDKLYRASITVALRGDKYVVTDYLRDPGK